MKSDRLEVKKRLMFIKEEDYYYLTYNMLLFLSTLGCTDKSKAFTDLRKLAYIIDFISDTRLINILWTYKNPDIQPNAFDKHLLYKSYSDSIGRISSIMRLLYALEKRGFIHFERDTSTIDIWIDKTKLPEKFIDNDIYYVENHNAECLKKLHPRISSLTLKTLVKKIYDENGVKTWGV